MSVVRYATLSAARPVHMADEWYAIANLEHFWIRRRFEVLRALCGPLLEGRPGVAEVGCGNGLVQRQLEDEIGVAVDGFDLNTHALEQSLCRRGRLACYDVHDRNDRLRGLYDLVLLLDVLEHVEDEAGFLDDAAFLAVPGGHLVVNVPASPRLYSRYDAAAGHLRRYTPRSLLEAGRRCGLEPLRWTFWGLPLVPLAAARKLAVRAAAPDDVIRLGFRPPAAFLNRWLAWLARLEPLPQHWFGTSLLAVFARPGP